MNGNPDPFRPDLKHPGLLEALGLRPFRERMAQAAVALRGAEDVPPSRFDRSSLALLRPRLGVPLWAGRWVVPRRAILTNLFNHQQTPIAEGWSVRRRQTLDFRGGDRTYDSHNGTDFCVPVGTPVVAPAPCVVARVWSEYNRGGNKVALDHGRGLMTSSAHLARVLVREGEILARGQPFGVSGYSGLDGLATFPWGIPHVHFNVWLDGAPVDPFARAGSGEASLWRGASGMPSPADPGGATEVFEASDWDMARIDVVIAGCRTARVRETLSAVGADRRGGYLVSERCYYPTRFPDMGGVCASVPIREGRLSMPFSSADVDGVIFSD